MDSVMFVAGIIRIMSKEYAAENLIVVEFL